MKINGKEIVGSYFVWDDCHKIYIIEDNEDMESVKDMWGLDVKFYTIDLLEEIYNKSCPLRFIENWKLDKYYAEQFENATFEK